MGELRKDPSLQQLFDRIVRLERLVATLSKDLQRLAKTNFTLHEQDGQLWDIHSRDLNYAFERIKNIELKFFPNLARDIAQADQITGDGDDKAHNPLDVRKKKPKT